MLIARRAVSLLALCGLAGLAWYSVLLARADIARTGNNLASLGTAVRLVPANAEYHALLAEYLEAGGEDPDRELEIATELSPDESRYWIRRGFRAELEKKYEDSERYLLRAYRDDRGFDPRWALTNYYFRRGRWPEFWKSARAALDMSYGNSDSIFRLCLAASDDPSATRQILPPRRDILSAFFDYLIEHEHVDSAAPMAGDLASGAVPDDAPVLVDYAARQIGHDDKSALMVWNALCIRHLLPFAALAPEQGNIVTNGDFAATPLQKVFDWKYSAEPNVAVGPIEAAPGISIALSGTQPDYVPLIQQEIPLTAEKQYLIHYDYRTIGDGDDIGLRWVIQGFGSVENQQAGSQHTEPVGVFPVVASQDWNSGAISFSAGQRDTARLVLEYRRTPTTLRWKGAIQIRRVTSGLAQSGLRK